MVLLFTALLTTFLAGCGGGNSGGETTAIPPQTGDVAVFPNAPLLASLAEVNSPTTPTIVLDARRSDAEYNAGHIPGAIFAKPSLFENSGVLLPDSELETILGNMGITRTSKIIIYDDTITSRGAAGRLFWILEYLGCTDVTILNGGWDQWENEKEGTQGTTTATVISPTVFTAQTNPAVKRVDKEYVASQLPPGPNFILIDVRTDEEYLGTQPDSTDPRPGHIPGAINFPYSKCFNSDKTVLNFKDLKLLLEAHGITNDKDLVAYSTVGHRSGFFYFLCRLMGYENISNYVGSIVDWGKADPTLYPMKLGTEP
jgi:thiosulfate/3-mercaptopyruvate sulfurtransferase